jgi:type II secretory pathway pseudopilin PulG
MLRPPFNPSLPGFSRKKTAGFTLIEVAIASVLVAMLGTGVLMFITDQLRTSEAQASGTALSALNTAVGNYEATYSINLSNHTAIPIPGFANVANPYSPTTTELTELGFLKYTVPAGTYGIAINPTVVNGTPSGLVWILKPFTTNLGGASQDLAAAAMISAGGDAAISTVANPSVVAGVDGWNAANPQGSVAAIVAMRNGAGSAAFVRLDGSTPMQGSLNLGGYNVTNASTVSAATVAANTVTASGNITGGNVAAAGRTTSRPPTTSVPTATSTPARISLQMATRAARRSPRPPTATTCSLGPPHFTATGGTQSYAPQAALSTRRTWAAVPFLSSRASSSRPPAMAFRLVARTTMATARTPQSVRMASCISRTRREAAQRVSMRSV